MELEEAKKKLNNFILETNKIKDTSEEWHGYMNDELHELKRTVETVLQALDNSIPKEKVKKIVKYCKTKSKFQTFGDEQLKRAIEVYVNKTKNDVLSLLEE